MPAALKTADLTPPRAPATAPALAHLYVAPSDGVGPGRSPALELQEALELMLATSPHETTKPMNAVVLAAGLASAAVACAAFWVSIARVLISAV